MEAERTIPVCYRHPDRETRLACTHCDRPVCWDCVTPAPVGQRCPECARDTGPRIRAVRRDTAPVSMGVIGVAAAVFVLGLLAPAVGRELFLWFGQHNASVLAGDSYRVVTAGFLHAGFTHILFNMWALSAFGPPLEREAGSTAFGGMYLASLLCGGLAYLWLGEPGGFAVGASGAIFGLFGAWTAIAVANRHTVMGQAQLRQMLMLLGINAALPILVPQIAWQAHLGGFLAGFLLGMVWSAVRGQERATVLRAASGYGLAALAWLALLLT
ncbi:MAG TPA: rhomboid family intramembrane serine protease [Egibacteraceae bacterium]|nr:rhomboid family intramembrane serine protease [Egibacteraceae bacterium]